MGMLGAVLMNEILPMRKPAILGGEPIVPYVLGIVRPRFPRPETFLDSFVAGLDRGQVTNNGPAVLEFERMVSDYCGAPAVICSSGQAALMMMLRAAGVTGGEVLVPSYTFSATPHAVSWCGASAVFADMKNMVIDPADAERRITPNTVAILGVDVYGLACDYDALEA